MSAEPSDAELVVDSPTDAEPGIVRFDVAGPAVARSAIAKSLDGIVAETSAISRMDSKTEVRLGSLLQCSVQKLNAFSTISYVHRHGTTYASTLLMASAAEAAAAVYDCAVRNKHDLSLVLIS